MQLSEAPGCPEVKIHYSDISTARKLWKQWKTLPCSKDTWVPHHHLIQAEVTPSQSVIRVTREQWPRASVNHLSLGEKMSKWSHSQHTETAAPLQGRGNGCHKKGPKSQQKGPTCRELPTLGTLQLCPAWHTNLVLYRPSTEQCLHLSKAFELLQCNLLTATIKAASDKVSGWQGTQGGLTLEFLLSQL